MADRSRQHNIHKMKITIVIPVYNVEPYIEDCLKSVAAQTYKGDIECIVIDDCTPDGSCAIIERFIKEYNGNIDFKLLHHSVNRGLSAARNTGIDAATGEYIYFLDSDDEITPDCIELLAEPLKEQKYDFVIGNYDTIGSDIKFPPLLLKHGALPDNDNIRNTFFTEQWYMMAWNKLCKLEFLRKEKLYFKEGLLNEDNLWSFQLACTAQSMYVIKEDTYRYKVRESSIMGKLQLRKKILAFATITQEASMWSRRKKLTRDEAILRQLLFYRNIALGNIFTFPTYKERREVYMECHRQMKIKNPKLFSKRLSDKRGILKELYNYIPGIFGFWYLCLYRKLFKGCL